MLTCGQCGYELTGLVKGPEAVVCPECGKSTEHINGWVRPAKSWRLLGRGCWLAVTAPAIGVLATSVAAWISRRIDPDVVGTVAGIGALAVGLILLFVIGWARNGLAHSPLRTTERIQVVFEIACVSVVLAFMAMVGFGWLMRG